MKIIRVPKCTNCPSLVQNEDIHFWDLYWYCGRMRRHLGKTISDIPEAIPEWCPLEDA